MVFNNTVYNWLKFLALVLLPGAAALYFALAQIWGLPNAEQVIGTMTVIDTFLGLVLKSSTDHYKSAGGGTDGDLIIEQVDGERFMALGLNKKSAATMGSKDTVTLRVMDKSLVPDKSGG